MNIRDRITNILRDWGFLPRLPTQHASIGWRPDPWNHNDGMVETSPGEFTGDRDIRVSHDGVLFSSMDMNEKDSL